MAASTGFENPRVPFFIPRPCRYWPLPNDYLPSLTYAPEHDIRPHGGMP